MAYQLKNPDGLDPDVAFVVREALDLRMSDVHTMLRLPIARVGMQAGCNFAIVDMLVSTIAGVSTVLYPRGPGGDGELFKKCIADRWPLDEPKPRIEREELAEELWKKIRNPMAHCLGMALEKQGNVRLPAEWGHSVKIVRDRGSWTAPELELIEGAQWPKLLARPTGQWSEGFLKLSCEALYRGVRGMTQAILRDGDEMRAAGDRLRELGLTTGRQTFSGTSPVLAQTTGALPNS